MNILYLVHMYSKTAKPIIQIFFEKIAIKFSNTLIFRLIFLRKNIYQVYKFIMMKIWNRILLISNTNETFVSFLLTIYIYIYIYIYI